VSIDKLGLAVAIFKLLRLSAARNGCKVSAVELNYHEPVFALATPRDGCVHSIPEFTTKERKHRAGYWLAQANRQQEVVRTPFLTVALGVNLTRAADKFGDGKPGRLFNRLAVEMPFPLQRHSET
jgi:hypothetical protein